jgi:NAD(P)-dependent dehydrogenase (short-subunit alcohol dehydrogenase family)
MPHRLQGKTAIITGSSSGLGRAIAILYAKEGASVVCADLRPEARLDIAGEGEVNTDELIRREGGKVVFVRCDVGKAEDWQMVVGRCVEEWGRVDMYVLFVLFLVLSSVNLFICKSTLFLTSLLPE